MGPRSLLAAGVAVVLISAMGATRGIKSRPADEDSDATPRQIAVLPFENVDGSLDISTVGDEVAEDVGNALNKVGGISVVGQDIMRKQVLGDGSSEIVMNLTDAILAAKRLNIATLVTGKYKRVGSSLEIDCSLIEVRTGQSQDGKSIVLTKEYPKDYVALLRELPEQVEDQFQPPAASTSRPKSVVPSEVSNSFDAHQLYATGLQRAKFDTIPALTDARESYRQALKKDSEFAQAYAAKSEAEIEIAQIKDGNHQDAKQDRADAVEDALAAVKRAPYYGAAHWQLSRAYGMIGNFMGAELSARVAAQLWPANGEVLLDLGRAVGQGAIVDNPEVRQAVRLTPSLALVTPDMPRVTVANGGSAEVQVTFTQATGRIFTSLKVPPGESRIVGLIAGKYNVHTNGGGDTHDDVQVFVKNVVYTIDGRTLIAENPDNTGTHITGPRTLVITCDVTGAKVLINHKEVGSAPMEWVVDEDVAPDWLFNIEVTADGYEPFIVGFHAASGRKIPIKVKLKPKATSFLWDHFNWVALCG